MKNYCLTIKPAASRSLIDEIAEIWHHKELLFMFARRDIAIRYKQAVIGFLWIVLQPIIMTAIFTFVFKFIARVPTEIPYPIHVMSGLILWQYFSRCLTEGSLIMVEQANVITKIYFPRLLLPLSICLSAALDFFFAAIILTIFIAVSGMPLGWPILTLPVFMIMGGLLAYGISLFLAPLNALYRDIGIVLPFLVQVLMFVSPIIYPVSAVPEQYQHFFLYNPVATIIESMRWAILDGPAPPLAAYIWFFVLTGLLILCGLKVFRLLEAKMVDRI